MEWVTGCRPHPGNIVEPASLAVIESVLDNEGEDISQSLPGETITAGHLSSLQLESVRKAVSIIHIKLSTVKIKPDCIAISMRTNKTRLLNSKSRNK